MSLIRRILGVSAVLGLSLYGTTGAQSAETKLKAYYVADLLRNVDGGRAVGSQHIADVGLILDTEPAWSFGESGRLFAYALWNNGSDFSREYVGDFQVVSNVDAPRELRLFELWYQQQIAQSVSLRFGLYDLNAEFDFMKAAQLFVNSSHGIGAEYAQSGRNGPSIFPVTSLAARLEWRFGDDSLLRYALLDGVPGDDDDPLESGISLGGGDGVLHALEYETALSDRFRFTLGGWLYSAAFPRVDGRPSPEKGNGGAYTSMEWALTDVGGGAPAVDAFIRYGVADEELNRARSYIGAGIVATGLYPRRPDDRLGIAVASARFGDPYRSVRNFDSHETVVELTYRAPVNDWLTIQPDVQYVVNPGGDPGLDDALVVGIRIEIGVSGSWPQASSFASRR